MRTELPVYGRKLCLVLVFSSIKTALIRVGNGKGFTIVGPLQKTFENRGHFFTVEQFEQVMHFDSDEAMQKKWKAFCRKIDTKTDDFSDVLNAIEVFLTEPLSAAVGKYAFTQKWSANSCARSNTDVQRNM